MREKRREDALRDVGCDMVRWGWTDLNTPRVLYPRILAAITRAANRPGGGADAERVGICRTGSVG